MKKVQGKKQREGEAAEATRKAIIAAAYNGAEKENEEQRPKDIPLPEAENILGDQDDRDIIF